MARYGYGGWAPYVTVAQRRAMAARMVARLRKQGRTMSPVEIEGRKIARTFWGRAWCDNLETYSDQANRLPRGRRYARNGSVIDLQVEAGQVVALVSGSEIYEVDVQVDPTREDRWHEVVRRCTGRIDSVVELLSGRFSKGVMEVLASREGGLFPSLQEIQTGCTCPDYARMCKHIAAVLYGIGARLDHEPELLFVLRQVDTLDLIAQAEAGGVLGQPTDGSTGLILGGDGLAELFGIELEAEADVPAEQRAAAQAPGLRPLLNALTRPTLLRICESFDLSLGSGYTKRAALVRLLEDEQGLAVEEVLAGLRRKELERVCARLGLPTSGRSKAVLVTRILEGLSA